MDDHLTNDWDFWELLFPQIFRGVSLMPAMVPINNVALGTLPPERLKNASGLYNLTRNLGGAVGLALTQHDAERSHRPAYGATSRGGHLVALQPALEALNSLTQQLFILTAATHKPWR